MKYSKEVKTGLLALVAIFLFIFGYSFLKGKTWFDSSRVFYAVYDDVEGLSPSSAVTINGLKVGSVTKIGFLNNTGELLVTFTVDTELPFSENSVAQVYGGGFIGGKSLAIIPEFEQGNLATEGDTLPGEIEEGLLELVNERLTPLQEKVETAIVSTDSLINSFNQVMNTGTRQNLIESIEDLNLAITSIKNSSQSVENILSENRIKIDTALTNFVAVSENLQEFSSSLDEIELAEMSNSIQDVIANLETMSEKLNSGDGTAAKLLNDPSVYNNLERATNQLDNLIQDVKLNPKRYVHFSIFGKNPGPYSPPEDSLR